MVLKMQTTVKSRAKMVNTTFPLEFTTPFPTRLHFLYHICLEQIYVNLIFRSVYILLVVLVVPRYFQDGPWDLFVIVIQYYFGQSFKSESFNKGYTFLLQASWDEPTQTVIMHRGAEPSLLQSLALQLADKVTNLHSVKWSYGQVSRNQSYLARNFILLSNIL